ncbi:MAG: GTP cyclohydrolase FolE2 [Burkholderiaceae bacterium]
MNKPNDSSSVLRHAAAAMPDIQGSIDARNLPIDRVGVRGLRYPVVFGLQNETQLPSIAEFSLSVGLAADRKGTHMSRFVALLETMNKEGRQITPASMAALVQEMVSLLEASEGSIELNAPFFIEKAAPVSGVKSLMDYRVGFEAHSTDGRSQVLMRVAVPVKSLCPCSKEISDYGAHNQRSEVKVSVTLANPSQYKGPGLVELIKAVESQASCELWGLLKRPDEKYVTERAYENAKFVEDLVRDVALTVGALPGVTHYVVEAENFESIHNHSAWARITGPQAH